MLHASDHLCLPIYQLICLPINLLLLAVHLYFLYYNVWVDSILGPVRVLFYIEFLFFWLGLYRLSKCLKILIIRSYWCLWRILLGSEFGTYIGSSTPINWWTLATCRFCPCFNHTSSCVCLLFLSGRPFQTRLSGRSLWTWKCDFFFFKGLLLSERRIIWLCLLCQLACWIFWCCCCCLRLA